MMTGWRCSTTVLLLTVLYSGVAESKLVASDPPTLPELQRFPVKDEFENIVDEIANEYETFGIRLLDDNNGLRIKGIEKTKRGDPTDITIEIVRQWLQGKGRKPVTWQAFVECLRESRLDVPADHIEAALGRSDVPTTSPQQPASSTIGILAAIVVGIVVMVIVFKVLYSSVGESKLVPSALNRVMADWSWPLKPSKNSPNKTKEAYPLNKTREKVALTFEYTIPALSRMKPDPINEVYLLQTQRPRGVCVIISNEKFTGTDHPDREGTDKDEKNLSRTFRYLGYHVEIYQNRKACEILGIFEELKKRDFSSHDSLVCCILSHGEEGKVFGSDSRAVELADIYSLITADKCPTLQNKPKLFFIQACRGKVPTKAVAKRDPGFKVQKDDGGATRPVMADFFFGYATPPGFAAFRDIDHGSWYISKLCEVFCTHAKFAELKEMHTRVNSEVGTYTCDDLKGSKEAPEQHSLLTKDFYFF